MPITSSAKKAMRQTKTRNERNVKQRNAYKTAIKSYKKLVTAKKPEEAQKQLSLAYKALDKAAKTNVISKTKAARTKSRISRLVGKK